MPLHLNRVSILWFVITVLSCISLWTHNIVFRKNPWEDDEEPRASIDSNKRGYWKGIVLVGLIYLGFAITAAELQLRWNHIVGINAIDTTGQIIPLAFGIMSMLRMIAVLLSKDHPDYP